MRFMRSGDGEVVAGGCLRPGVWGYFDNIYELDYYYENIRIFLKETARIYEQYFQYFQIEQRKE